MYQNLALIGKRPRVAISITDWHNGDPGIQFGSESETIADSLAFFDVMNLRDSAFKRHYRPNTIFRVIGRSKAI